MPKKVKRLTRADVQDIRARQDHSLKTRRLVPDDAGNAIPVRKRKASKSEEQQKYARMSPDSLDSEFAEYSTAIDLEKLRRP